MKQRLLTALLITPIAIAIILLVPTLVLATLIGALCLVALWEWTRLSGMRSRPWRGVLVGAAGMAMAILWCMRDSTFWWTTIAIGVAWWFVAVLWLRRFSFAAAPTRENAALKICAGALAVLPAWTAMMQLHGKQSAPHTWALYALTLVWVADTFAYVAGRTWGKAKLAPRISPGKTLAGVYGALVGSAVIAVFGGWLLQVRGATLIALVAVALLAVLFSVVGDLFESLVKRHAGVKDSGAMFPGHGGVFDRLDGVFAAIPIFALGVALLGL